MKSKKNTQQKEEYKIMEASIKDDFCKYKFEITSELGEGDKHTVNGQGIIKDSMKRALNKLSVHLAIIDDKFKDQKVEISNVDKFHNHNITTLYTIKGFKIKGDAEADDERVVIIGSKFVTVGNGQVEIQSPPIPLGGDSFYKFRKQLKEVVDQCRLEVTLYKEGNYIPVKQAEEKDDAQLTIPNEE